MSHARRVLRARWIITGALAAIVMTAFTVLPVFGSGHPDADRLRMTESFRGFFYGSDSPGSATDVQRVTVGSKGCEIAPLAGGGTGDLAGPLVTLSSNGGNGGIKDPGYVDFGIGVKTGGSNGTPCSEVDGNEVLTITSANTWSKLRLDVQVKADVRVVAELLDTTGSVVATHELLTGASIEAYNNEHNASEAPVDTELPYTATTSAADSVEACADPSDSGPDAHLKDNCLWTIEPGRPFKALRVSVHQGIGAVSLEGGSDYEAFDPAGFSIGAYDSLFYRAEAPTAVDDDDVYSTNEDTLLNVDAAGGVLANDTDPLNAALNATLVSTTSHGVLSLASDGSFTYDPQQNWFGTDTFTYQATAGGEPSNVATATITVGPVNDDPVPIDGPLAATEETQTTYQGSDLATDIEEDALTVFSALATNGQVDTTGGTAAYTPNDDFCGTDQLTFEVTDDGSPTGSTGSSTVAIDVACLADNDSFIVDEREELEDVVVYATLTIPAPGVLANDGDTPGDLLASNATDPSGNGSVTLNGNGSFTYSPGLHVWSSGEFSYQETWGYTVTYLDLSTQTATVTVTVNRNLCQADTVTDEDGDVFGSFTLLSADGCKNYAPVIADDTTETVLFQPDSPGTIGIYDGELRIEDVVITDGTLDTVILKYDPSGGTAFDPVPSCVGDAASPVLPGGATTGWCFYDVDPVLTGTSGEGEALWTITWKVRGWDDPKFSFK